MKEEKIIRFFNNQSSQEEKKEVSSWLDQPGAEQELEVLLKKRWEAHYLEDSSMEAEYQNLLQQIHNATRGKSKTGKARLFSKRILGMGRIAATYLLWICGAYALYQSWQPINNGSLTEEIPVEMVDRKTAAGEKLTILLPDHSKVIMNSLSAISFSSDFGKKERLIILEGEAYFEVSPDKNKPFQVKTGSVVTTAMGTAFNASSRGDQIEIALTEGKVLVSNEGQGVNLNPGERAAVKDSIQVGAFDKELVTAWKEGKITFKKETMNEILLLLEKWYGVTFKINGPLNKSRTVSGTFHNQNLGDILNGLSFSVGFVYKIDGQNVQIQ